MTDYALHCSGGLCNRLLGLLSARAKHPEAHLHVYWPVGSYKVSKAFPRLDAKFEQLYADLPGVTFIPLDQLEQLKRKKMKYGYSHGVLPNTPSQLLYPWKTLFQLRDPTLYLKAKSQLVSPYTGCLIRCHGHHFTSDWKPQEKFTSLLKSLSKPVFICCDDSNFASRFPSSVSVPKPGPIGSISQLTGVAADLQILAEADEFYSPPFTAMAVYVQLLRDQPLHAHKPIGDWSKLQ